MALDWGLGRGERISKLLHFYLESIRYNRLHDSFGVWLCLMCVLTLLAIVIILGMVYEDWHIWHLHHLLCYFVEETFGHATPLFLVEADPLYQL
jgi:hypothetical protein